MSVTDTMRDLENFAKESAKRCGSPTYASQHSYAYGYMVGFLENFIRDQSVEVQKNFENEVEARKELYRNKDA
jgi:hypothetical protein